MTPKTLSTLVDADSPDLDVLAYAVSLAQACDAHLNVFALAVDRSHAGFSYTDMSAIVAQTGLKEARDAARNLVAQLRDDLKPNTSLKASIEPLVTITGSVCRSLTRHMRFSDLAILPRPYGPNTTESLVDAVECTLFDAGLPLLIVPPGHTTWQAPQRVVLAWNESREALHAARAARSLIAGADTTFVTVIDPPQHGPDRSDPGGLLSQFLARHGGRCEVDVLAKSMPRTGDVLLRHIADRQADMLVMGAYGRARWSEAMFGGATRHILEEATLPVFMAH